MERTSSSRGSWADEVEDEELPGGSLHAAPPPAGLNLNAEPFFGPASASRSPAMFEWGERLSFTDSEESDGSDPASPEASAGRGKAAAAEPQRRCRRPRRRRRARSTAGAGFMEAARRSLPPLELRPRPSHPVRTSGPPDADGYHQVQSRKRWRRRSPPKKTKPVPAHLAGRCFNCGGDDHIRATCTSSSRCLNCGSECHRVRDCPFPTLAPDATGKRRRGHTGRDGAGRAAPRRKLRPGHRASCDCDSTISGRSVSTGRSTSIPECCARSPERSAPPQDDATGLVPAHSESAGGANQQQADSEAPEQAVQEHDGPRHLPPNADALESPGAPPGERPRRHQKMVVVPRSAELEAAELGLRLALVALVAGTRPAVSPAMVRDYLA